MISPTRIILVRHGDVPGIDPPCFRGRTDLELTPVGVRQAEVTRDLLVKCCQPNTIYTSPLSRCVRTGDILAEPYSIAPSALAGLSDIDYGAWRGSSYEEVQSRQPELFNKWLLSPHLVTIPGGETLYDVAGRVAWVIRMILDKHVSETVLLVSHDTVNRVLLLLALELPLSRYRRIVQEPCGISAMEHDPVSGWTIRSINETAHLLSIAALSA